LGVYGLRIQFIIPRLQLLSIHRKERGAINLYEWGELQYKVRYIYIRGCDI